jgi:hypothetical protein
MRTADIKNIITTLLEKAILTEQIVKTRLYGMFDLMKNYSTEENGFYQYYKEIITEDLNTELSKHKVVSVSDNIGLTDELDNIDRLEKELERINLLHDEINVILLTNEWFKYLLVNYASTILDWLCLNNQFQTLTGELKSIERIESEHEKIKGVVNQLLTNQKHFIMYLQQPENFEMMTKLFLTFPPLSTDPQQAPQDTTAV